MGAVRLPDFLNLRPGVVALLVCLMALGAYAVAERVEQKFGNPDELPKGSRNVKLFSAGALILLGLILAIGYPKGLYEQKTVSALVPPKEKEPLTLQQKAAPVEKPKTSDSFRIVEDEGC